MLSIKECREILKDENLSEEEIDKVKKELEIWADLVLESFIRSRKNYERNNLLSGEFAGTDARNKS